MTANKCKYCYRDFRFKKPNNSKKPVNIKLVVFDMDGVLVDIYSSWKFVHDYFNTSNERSVEAYIKGYIDDIEFIRRDANLWKENGKFIKKEKLARILVDVPLMKGAEECIGFLKENGVKTAIVSSGLDVLADRISDKFGIDYVYSNGINVDKNGFLTDEGIIGVKLKKKDEAVKNLAKKAGIDTDCIVAVGNSCFDISMFEVAGLGIAFNPNDDCVKKYADFVIFDKDLMMVYNFLDKYI